MTSLASQTLAILIQVPHIETSNGLPADDAIKRARLRRYSVPFVLPVTSFVNLALRSDHLNVQPIMQCTIKSYAAPHVYARSSLKNTQIDPRCYRAVNVTRCLQPLGDPLVI